MKIYLLNPPFVPRYSRNSRWAARCRGGALYYPIWLSYATGVLKKEGHKVHLVDAPAWGWNLENVKEDVRKFKPDLVVAESNFQSFSNDVEVTKTITSEVEAMSVLVGPPVSQFPERILDAGVDIAARFEYDFTIRDIAEILEKGSSLKHVKGISYKVNNKIIHNLNLNFAFFT